MFAFELFSKEYGKKEYISDEQGERIYKDIAEMEKIYSEKMDWKYVCRLVLDTDTRHTKRSM